MTALNALKFLVLFGLAGWVVLSSHAHVSILLPLAQRRAGLEAVLPAIASALVSGFFAFGSWWEAGKLAGEVRDPERNLPIAFVGGVLLVTATYLIVSFTFLTVVPISGMSSSIDFVSQFGRALFGAFGARALSVCVLLCVGGGLAALTMGAPRVSYAMAQAGEFFPVLGQLHKRFQTPANAILLQTGLSVIVLLLGSFVRILAYIILFRATFSRDHGDDSVPYVSSASWLVVPSGAGCVSCLLRRDRSAPAAAKPAARPCWVYSSFSSAYRCVLSFVDAFHRLLSPHRKGALVIAGKVQKAAST